MSCEEPIEDRPELSAVVGPLLKARQAIERSTDDLDRKVLKLARYDVQPAVQPACSA
jgi:hypothetical protein